MADLRDKEIAGVRFDKDGIPLILTHPTVISFIEVGISVPCPFCDSNLEIAFERDAGGWPFITTAACTCGLCVNTVIGLIALPDGWLDQKPQALQTPT